MVFYCVHQMLLNLLCFSLLTSGSSLEALLCEILCDSWLEKENLP